MRWQDPFSLLILFERWFIRCSMALFCSLYSRRVKWNGLINIIVPFAAFVDSLTRFSAITRGRIQFRMDSSGGDVFDLDPSEFKWLLKATGCSFLMRRVKTLLYLRQDGGRLTKPKQSIKAVCWSRCARRRRRLAKRRRRRYRTSSPSRWQFIVIVSHSYRLAANRWA